MDFNPRTREGCDAGAPAAALGIKFQSTHP